MKSLKIVIADNESVIRMDVREMLEEASMRVSVTLRTSFSVRIAVSFSS